MLSWDPLRVSIDFEPRAHLRCECKALPPLKHIAIAASVKWDFSLHPYGN